ncbi:uncharacterized protein BDW43DRAFT_275060 [Aspergillus alliaceus]|uniref:uncharacterized protein n=1 Tax=Petromyces alliaceus TaxID=209559 RepID=UPI0012A6D60A|nr:uncharacterized protein BDW43DRAFT_275060 [Aspergillus alliaceus]KAB8233772.1 hypothetical protein BDW43DRAFT_275060 [Aspergillus alliaceus]
MKINLKKRITVSVYGVLRRPRSRLPSFLTVPFLSFFLSFLFFPFHGSENGRRHVHTYLPSFVSNANSHTMPSLGTYSTSPGHRVILLPTYLIRPLPNLKSLLGR